MLKSREALVKHFTVFVVVLALMAIASGYLWLVLLLSSISLLFLSAFYKRPLYMLSQLSSSLLVSQKCDHDYPGSPPALMKTLSRALSEVLEGLNDCVSDWGGSEPPSPRKTPRSPNKRSSSTTSHLYRCGSACSLERLDENDTDLDVSSPVTKRDGDVPNFDLRSSFNSDAQVPLKKPTPTTPPRDRSSMGVGQGDHGAQMPRPQEYDAQGFAQQSLANDSYESFQSLFGICQELIRRYPPDDHCSQAQAWRYITDHQGDCLAACAKKDQESLCVFKERVLSFFDSDEARFLRCLNEVVDHYVSLYRHDEVSDMKLGMEVSYAHLSGAVTRVDQFLKVISPGYSITPLTSISGSRAGSAFNSMS